MKSLIHIGVPKTATTSLQFNLFSRATGIEFLGKPYYNEKRGYEASKACADLTDMIWKLDYLEYDTDKAKKLFDVGIKPWVNKEKQLVLSEEGFTSPEGADRFLTAIRLKELFGDVKILITIRNQWDCLRSYYLWFYTRRIIHKNFDVWIEECLQKNIYRQKIDNFPLRQFKFDEILWLYQEVFGANNVEVIVYEDIIERRDEFCKRFSAILNASQQEIQESIEMEAKNKSLSKLSVSYQRVLRGMTSAYQLFLKDGKREITENLSTNGIHGYVTNVLSRFGKYNVSVSRETYDYLNAYYSEGNRRLEQILGVALDQYNYPIIRSEIDQ